MTCNPKFNCLAIAGGHLVGPLCPLTFALSLRYVRCFGWSVFLFMCFGHAICLSLSQLKTSETMTNVLIV